MEHTRAILIWLAIGAALVLPIALAATSPLLAWRDAVYVFAGFAGIVALALLMVQPLLAGGYLPALSSRLGRRWHVWTGGGIAAAVIAHVAGLWITSPPDVVDVLLFRSPTPFSVWGVVAMWAVFVTAGIALARRKLRLRPALWRVLHFSLVIVIVAGTVVHAVLIEGTMEQVSKLALCAMVSVVSFLVILKHWPRSRGIGRRPDPNLR